MKPAARCTAPRSAAPEQVGLSFVTLPGRLIALERERGRLLKDITRMKVALERLRQRAMEVGSQILNGTMPLMVEHQRLSAEVHALFAELLGGNGWATARQRREITSVYRSLLTIIGPKPASDEPASWDDPEEPPPFAGPAGGYSAPRNADGPGHESLAGVAKDRST